MAATPLPFKLGGNMPGRGMGERLTVDPNDDAVLYMGMPSGNGLWKSTDYGATWAQVTAFPNVGNYAQDSTDTTGYLSDNQGVAWVAFDKAAGTTGAAGTPTKTIFVGVADLQNTVYESTDGGVTWSRVAGQPTGFLAHKGLVDPTGGYLYITTSDKGGPYDGASGDVWKYAIATGTWTQISPVKSSDTSNDYYGYSGLTIDQQHPNTHHGHRLQLVVAGHVYLPLHRRRRDVDERLVLQRLPEPRRQVHAGRLGLAVADVGHLSLAAGGDAEAGLDDRGPGDRPVQQRPDDVRHRRDAVRHHEPDRVGLRHAS